MSVNLVSLTGNITRDAELRQTNQNGTSVLNFSIACNDRRRNQQTGEWEDYANFFDCSVFGKRAEAIHKFCTKGTKVAIQGRLRQNTWVDKETGRNRSRVTIVCDELDFMTRRNDNNGGYNNNNYNNNNGGNGNGNNGGGGSYENGYDDDVPF